MNATDRTKEIEAIQLTEDEIKQAIFQAKLAKWFKARNAKYWEERAKIKINVDI
jgi:hypothetical protein